MNSSAGFRKGPAYRSPTRTKSPFLDSHSYRRLVDLVHLGLNDAERNIRSERTGLGTSGAWRFPDWQRSIAQAVKMENAGLNPDNILPVMATTGGLDIGGRPKRHPH